MDKNQDRTVVFRLPVSRALALQVQAGKATIERRRRVTVSDIIREALELAYPIEAPSKAPAQ